MDDPAREIEGVIRALTQTAPAEQRHTVLKYFTPDAAFTHPFCRTGSFDGSRLLILAIYRWYKIMSPRIDLNVHSVTYDPQNLLLYAMIQQTFRIWLIPFYRADVELVTVLQLVHDAPAGKYYIASQNDLYQVDQFVRFVTWPFGWLLVMAWQLAATAACLLGAALFWPITWFEQHAGEVQDGVRVRIEGAANELGRSTEGVRKQVGGAVGEVSRGVEGVKKQVVGVVEAAKKRTE